MQRRVAFGWLQASQRLLVSSSKACPLSAVVKTAKADGFWPYNQPFTYLNQMIIQWWTLPMWLEQSIEQVVEEVDIVYKENYE